jgi:hypothetical protein
MHVCVDAWTRARVDACTSVLHWRDDAPHQAHQAPASRPVCQLGEPCASSARQCARASSLTCHAPSRGSASTSGNRMATSSSRGGCLGLDLPVVSIPLACGEHEAPATASSSSPQCLAAAAAAEEEEAITGGATP